jgi:enoyl-CoA hydratase/carnithine racemase
MTREVLVDRPAPGVGIVTLNRPERLNALSLNMIYEELPSAVDELDADPEVSVIVLTGAGRGFCAGADLDSGAFDMGDQLPEHMRKSHVAPLALVRSKKLTIAAINGPAAGAGFGLAMCCDLRLGARTTKFVTAFIAMGMVPDFGLTFSLPATIGRSRALRLLLSPEPVFADRAEQLGIVSSLHDDVRTDALALAASLARVPTATGLIRSGVDRALAEGAEATLLDIEPTSQGTAMATEEFRELFAQQIESVMGPRR